MLERLEKEGMKYVRIAIVFIVACFCMCAPFTIKRFNTWYRLQGNAGYYQLTGAGDLVYWQDHLTERCEQIRSVMAEAGWNKSAFLWYTDSHWNYSYQKSPALLKYLYEHTPINKTNFGGDIIAVEGDTAKEMEYLWDWRYQIRDLPNHHSVPGNHDDGNDIEERYSDEYIYSYLLAAEETPDVVRGNEGLYYYIDVPSEKTRYLYLDTATSLGNISEDEKQLIWLRNTLLSTNEDWHIVAISHIWRDVNYHTDPPTDNGFSLGGQICLNEFDLFNAREDIYAECKAKVEFCIGGHTHADGDYRSDGGIPVLLTETDSSVIRSGLEAVPTTITEASVNAIVADYESKLIHVIRIGRGESRTVSLEP